MQVKNKPKMNKFRCILIIDDDEISNYLTEITIKTEGLAGRIETALNGEEGLNKLKNLDKNGMNGKPDLILLDISMPVLDGFGFLQKFNEIKLDEKPKVVMLTSSHNPKDILRVKEFNITGYLNKPFSTAALMQLMNYENKFPI
jgi:CheY-like chemotaxis protein